MSMVLSIYSQKGFREITLPERGANELQILLQKELFALETDIRLTAERSDDVWSVRTQDGAVFVQQGRSLGSAVEIKDGMKLEVDAVRGSRITVIAFQQNDPLTVYSKYSLAGIRQITIGAAVFQHIDAVTVHHVCQPVGDQDHRLFPRQTPDGRHDHLDKENG